MAFTSKPTITITVDQVIDLVDQLSTTDKLKVFERMRARQPRSKIIDDMIATFSKVKMSEDEVTALVEEVRAERYASKKARTARR